MLVQREKFLAINRDVAWCLDAQADLPPVNVDNRDADVIPDVNFLPELTTEN
jgi:hypothetical protein